MERDSVEKVEALKPERRVRAGHGMKCASGLAEAVQNAAGPQVNEMLGRPGISRDDRKLR